MSSGRPSRKAASAAAARIVNGLQRDDEEPGAAPRRRAAGRPRGAGENGVVSPAEANASKKRRGRPPRAGVHLLMLTHADAQPARQCVSPQGQVWNPQHCTKLCRIKCKGPRQIAAPSQPAATLTHVAWLPPQAQRAPASSAGGRGAAAASADGRAAAGTRTPMRTRTSCRT